MFSGIRKDGRTTLPNVSPSYDLINNLLLFGTTASQINASGFYAFMPHKIGKQRYVIELIQKILCKAVTKRVRVNHFFIQTIFYSIVFQLLSNSPSRNTLAKAIKKKVATCTIGLLSHSAVSLRNTLGI